MTGSERDSDEAISERMVVYEIATPSARNDTVEIWKWKTKLDML